MPLLRSLCGFIRHFIFILMMYIREMAQKTMYILAHGFRIFQSTEAGKRATSSTAQSILIDVGRGDLSQWCPGEESPGQN